MTKAKTAEITRQLKVDQISIIKANYVIKLQPTVKITTSQDIYKHLMFNWDLDTIDLHEEFKLILLNRSFHILGISTLTIGSKNGCIVDEQRILAMALITNASAIITAHNHPSGNIQPSEQDVSIYKKLTQSCDIMNVQYLDNLIITRDGYYSFTDSNI